MADNRAEPRPVWRAVVAALLSLFFAGLGHLFLRRYIRGVGFLAPSVFFYMISDYTPKGILLNIVFFIVSAVDAFSIGRRGFGIF
ncbi:MAG TPA: hypothetical protein VI382_04520 [Candidatus Manganitrophaceae bacterium]|nr:hypothetical protein [Candidatus Manganitrophaceae bacterium]